MWEEKARFCIPSLCSFSSAGAAALYYMAATFHDFITFPTPAGIFSFGGPSLSKRKERGRGKLPLAFHGPSARSIRMAKCLHTNSPTTPPLSTFELNS